MVKQHLQQIVANHQHVHLVKKRQQQHQHQLSQEVDQSLHDQLVVSHVPLIVVMFEVKVVEEGHINQLIVEVHQ
jgi:hypothetical protein